MLATVISILKIIGIVLLALIGFVLFVVLLLLFWPFFYRIKADKEDAISAEAKVSFFFHLVVLDVIYRESLNIRCKVLGIPIYDKQKKERKEDIKNTESVAKESGAASEKARKEEPIQDIKEPDLQETPKERQVDSSVVMKEEPDAYSIQATSDETESEKQSSKEDAKKRTESIGQKADRIINKIKSILVALPDKILSFIENIETKIESIIETVEYYDKLFSKKGTEWVISFLKQELLLILKHLKPYSSDIVVDYASTDPEKAAKIMEYYGLLYPVLPKRTKVTSDFTDDYLHFQIKIKGRFLLGYLIYHILKVVLNKKVKKFIKLVKREEA